MNGLLVIVTAAVMNGLLVIVTAADIWMIYCIWFRREPVSLMEVTMICGERQET